MKNCAGVRTKMPWRTLMAAGLLVLLGISAGVPAGALADEARAVWFHRWEWNDRQDIEVEITNIDNCHMNAVLFQIRGQGDAFYISEHEPWSHLVGDEYPGYDPLAVAIYEAHKKGLELHAYVNAMPAWSGSTPPVSPDHIYNAHPEWIMVDEYGVPMDPADGYADISPGIPQAAQHVNNVIMDIATNYDVDGIHLDYIRYPHPNYSHDDSSLVRFARDYPECTSPSTCPGEWDAFRRTLVTEMVQATYDSVTALKPWVKISAAVWGVFAYGYNGYYQDSHGWMEAGILDFSAPMIYTGDTTAFRDRLQDHVVNSYGRHVYGGIGIYLGFPPSTMVAEIETCRAEGAEGEVMFSASDLTSSYKLTLVGSGGPYEYLADIPAMVWKGSQPFIASVALPIDTSHVDLFFNRDVDAITGQTASNYTFDNGLVALSAVRDVADHRLIHLTTSTHYQQTIYTLTVNNVADEGAKEVVAWPNDQRKFYGMAQAPEIIVDDLDSSPAFTFVGEWVESVSGYCWEDHKRYHAGPGDGDETATWTTPITTPGSYKVYFWVNNGAYTADAHYYIDTYAGPDSAIGDQNWAGDGWHYLGTFPFADTARVTVTDFWESSPLNVIADAIKWVFISPIIPAPPAAITDLASHKSNADIVLTWSEVTSDTLGNPETISEYVVYRDTQPCSPPGDSVGSTADTTFTDPDAAEPTSSNYYYVVRAVDDGQAKSADSNQVGEFVRELITSAKADRTKKIKSLH